MHDDRIEENRNCSQCGATPGERHRNWDDIARCAKTGMQAIQCLGEEDLKQLIEDGENPDDYDTPFHPGMCILDVWDGEYPGVKACREFGWYTDANSPWGVMVDLNRLAASPDAYWDAELERYVLKNPTDMSSVKI